MKAQSFVHSTFFFILILVIFLFFASVVYPTVDANTSSAYVSSLNLSANSNNIIAMFQKSALWFGILALIAIVLNWFLQSFQKDIVEGRR